ncbi:hypothetical protein DIRU0_D30724 [Diutina rugosa]
MSSSTDRRPSMTSASAAAPAASVASPTLPAPTLSETTNITSTTPSRSSAIQATTTELTSIISALRRSAEAHLKLAAASASSEAPPPVRRHYSPLMAPTGAPLDYAAILAALPSPGEDNIDGVTFVNIVEPLARRADDHSESELFIKACSGRVAPFVAPAPATKGATKGATRASARHYCQWLRSQFVVVKLVALAPTAAVSEAQILRPTHSDVTRYSRYLSQLLPCDDIDGDKLAIIIATVWPLSAGNSPHVSDAMKHQLRQLGELHRDVINANNGEINWHPRLEVAALAIEELLADAVVRVDVT